MQNFDLIKKHTIRPFYLSCPAGRGCGEVAPEMRTSSVLQMDALNQEVAVSSEALQAAMQKITELRRLAQALEIELQSLRSMVSTSHFPMLPRGCASESIARVMWIPWLLMFANEFGNLCFRFLFFLINAKSSSGP